MSENSLCSKRLPCNLQNRRQGQYSVFSARRQSMTHAELLGYLAAACVFVTFYMKTMVPLRIAGIVSNFLFIGYGYAVDAYPVLILHLVLLPLNIVRLRQMLALIRQVEDATRGELHLDWVKPFSSM